MWFFSWLAQEFTFYVEISVVLTFCVPSLSSCLGESRWDQQCSEEQNLKPFLQRHSEGSLWCHSGDCSLVLRGCILWCSLAQGCTKRDGAAFPPCSAGRCDELPMESRNRRHYPGFGRRWGFFSAVLSLRVRCPALGLQPPGGSLEALLEERSCPHCQTWLRRFTL